MTAKSQSNREFGERLKEAFAGDNQARIAEKLEISNASVTAYIKGESLPSLDNLKKISVLTKRSLHWLLTGQGEADLDPYRFLNQTERRIIEKIAGDSKRSFEEVLRELVNEALVAQGAQLFAQYKTIGAKDLELLQELFRLFETEEGEAANSKPASSRRRAS